MIEADIRKCFRFANERQVSIMPERRMTWEEMVDRYPERWVAIRDAKMDGADIVSGIVEAVLTDDEVGDYMDQAAPELLFERTTEGNWYGPISAEFSIRVS
ncbi:MAG: hypothetical protein J6P45_08200 [Lachnospiraceae bacterium]|nr:hypothetical protein [Lachnospiraceae bacterium]